MTIYEADPKLIAKIDEAQERVVELTAQVKALHNSLNAAWAMYAREMIEDEAPLKKKPVVRSKKR